MSSYIGVFKDIGMGTASYLLSGITHAQDGATYVYNSVDFTTRGYEDQYLKNLVAAHSKLLEELKGAGFENVNDIFSFSGEGFAMIHSLKNFSKDSYLTLLLDGFIEAEKVHFENLSHFIEKDIPGENIEAKLNEAKNLERSGTPQDRIRLAYFERRFELQQPEGTEGAAYAKLLEARRNLKAAMMLEIPDHSKLQENYSQLEVNHEKKVLSWAREQKESTRLLHMQLGDDFISRGRRKVLEKRLDGFDKVIKTHFDGLYQNWKDTVKEAKQKLEKQLVSYDPKLVGKSRWKLFIFSWIFYFASRRVSSKVISPLKHRYEILSNEVNSNPILNSDSVKKIVEGGRTEILEAMDNESRLKFENASLQYQLDMRSSLTTASDTLETIISGEDAPEDVRLKMLFDQITVNHPKFKDKKITIDDSSYEEGKGLYIKGKVTDGTNTESVFNAYIGGNNIKELIENDFMSVLAIDGESETAKIAFNALLPQNFIALIKWDDARIRWDKKTKSEHIEKSFSEIFYSNENQSEGTIPKVGEKGMEDLTHSKIVVNSHVTYHTDLDLNKNNPKSSLVFESGSLRLGISAKDSIATIVGQENAGLVKKRYGRNGLKATIKLTGIQKQDGQIVFIGTINKEAKTEVVLTRGDRPTPIEIAMLPSRLKMRLDPETFKDSFYDVEANTSRVNWTSF